ncbi:MAG: aldolase [Methanocalculaceae archaeon]|jgi:L-fuculose-phosphate aldolase|nr:aldolase [Methanocalculaceae archaeon]
MNDQTLFTDFSRIGRRLFEEHLVGGNFGNMSIRHNGGYFITCTGSYLDADPAQIVFMPGNGRVTPGASSEWRVHTAIYNEVPEHRAVVHAHPVHAVALSLLCGSEIAAVDSEGKLLAPTITVVDDAPGTQELADTVASHLKNANVVIARGHGTFAAGKDMDQAYLFTSLAEHCCKVLLYTKPWQKY